MSFDIDEKIKQLPASMSVADVADFLGIALSTAYKLANSPDFPIVKIPNVRRIIISKQQFLNWYYQNNPCAEDENH